MDFNFGVSRQRRICVSVLHSLALAGCWLNALPAGCRVSLAALVVLSWAKAIVAEKVGPIQLRFHLSRGWSAREGLGEFLPIRLLPSSVVSRVVVAVHWRDGSGVRNSLAVFPDMLRRDQFRRLLVCLKISQIDQTK
ncbi:protein YgfX [Methylomonas sp. HW2-6]|uniref:protein YgfX n=1 Tax=Methylomonas sp. HW2-6 TaxID=3376687 RepID=UPI004041B800